MSHTSDAAAAAASCTEAPPSRAKALFRFTAPHPEPNHGAVSPLTRCGSAEGSQPERLPGVAAGKPAAGRCVAEAERRGAALEDAETQGTIFLGAGAS